MNVNPTRLPSRRSHVCQSPFKFDGGQYCKPNDTKRRKPSKFDQIKQLTALKEEFDFLYDVPTFRKKGASDAFRYPDPKRVKFEKDRIFLPKAGWTRIKMHRAIEGDVKNVTVSTIAGDWFVSIQVQQEIVVPENKSSRSASISVASDRSCCRTAACPSCLA
jgi:transposase